jgi:hypothetical protein
MQKIKKQHDKTHKVYELLDQNNDTPFYLYHDKKKIQIANQKHNLLRST